MRAVYLVGGPHDGKILHAEDLAEIEVPAGYAAVRWSGSVESKDWTEADLAALVHHDVPREQKSEMANAGIDEILKRFPDAGA